MILRHLVSIFLLSCSACSSAVENVPSERTHILYKPANLHINAPLVLALHGYGSNGRNLQWYSGMNEAADTHGFAVAYPYGTTDRGGTRLLKANLNIR